jgi:serine/threonine protein phosphatase PrpC
MTNDKESPAEITCGDTAEWTPLAMSAGGQRSAPFSSLVEVDAAGLSDQGKVRHNNEDHFLISRFGRFLEAVETNLPRAEIPTRSEEIGYAMLVADGIGGSQAGEVASKLAITTLVNLVLQFPDWILRLDEDFFIDEVLRRASQRYDQINLAMTEHAEDDPSLRGFGTTLTGAWGLGKDLFVAHIGDSRAYMFRSGRLRQLTRDHTLAQELANQGAIAQEDVATHHWRHVLTRSLGPRSRLARPDVQRLKLEDGDTLLLCTDGLTTMVGEQAIADILARDEAARLTCQFLVDRALAEGGRDNVTVIVARYRFP